MSDPHALIVGLRQVVADQDERLAAQEALLRLQRVQLQTQGELIKGQAAQLSNQDELLRLQVEQVNIQGEQIATQAELIKRLEEELAALRRQAGMDSTNSSVPPSRDSIAAKAKRRVERSSRERSKDRKPGGQPGRLGSGLTPTPDPDRTERVAPPAQCRDCRAELTDATELAAGWAQVWDVPPPVLEKTHYLLPRRRCGCGTTTTAPPPFGRAGTVSYGPNLNGAAVLLGSEGNVPVERAAMLIYSLLGVPVSTGFVARAAQRLAAALEAAGFDEAMKAALRAEDVLCGDESPVNVLANDLDETTGEQVAGAPHAVTLRTPDARLI